MTASLSPMNVTLTRDEVLAALATGEYGPRAIKTTDRELVRQWFKDTHSNAVLRAQCEVDLAELRAGLGDDPELVREHLLAAGRHLAVARFLRAPGAHR